MASVQRQKKRFIIIIIIVSVVLASFLAIVLSNAIKRAIYEERKTSLTQLVKTATRSINNNVEAQWEIARVYENDIKAHLSEYENVRDYLNYLNSQISNEGDSYFLVDSSGKYYASDGVTGKLGSTEYYTGDTDKELEYLDSLPHYKDGVTYLIFRTRLDNPVTVNTDNGTSEILYCALVHNVTPLVEYINTLFDGNNNTMIFDTRSGVMLYKQFGIRLLVDGYNVYDKYNKIELKYGENCSKIIESIKNKELVVSMSEIDGESYYLCSASLNISDWSLMLVVDSSYFDRTTGDAFGKIIIAIGAILAFAALLVIALFWYFSKVKIGNQLLANEKKLNEALNEAYSVKSNFLSYMSHEIRTPINGMIGMSKIGINNIDNKEKALDCFKKIDLSSKHLLSVVNDVLDMSAIESGKIVISNEKMNIEQTIESCLDIIRGSLDNRTLTIEESFDCNTKNVLGDEFHLKQVIINILSNAVKFTEDGGFIRIYCKQLEENDSTIKYEIKISDTGCGMTEEFQKHIFEAFRVAKPDGKTKYKGSGLGMTISYEYVKLMNGTISVESKINVGSTFTIVLPLMKSAGGSNDVELKNYNILLVDDNDINLEIEKEMLEGQVKSIQVAHDGKEALEKFSSSELNFFDIILMDIQMPIMNGYQATKEIRKSDRLDNDISIIALTANTYKDDIDAIFESGMDGYLNKPFSVEQLIEKISKGE